MKDKIKILAISGSLRASSSNTAILRIVIKLAPDNVEIELYEGLGGLPYFNPDLDNDEPPEPIQSLRKELDNADGVLICTPEYAHNIPGSLKNLLDWNVSSSTLYRKPVAVIATGEYALITLVETLRMVDTQISDKTTLLIPYSQSRIDADGNIKDAQTLQALKSLLNTCIQQICTNLI